LLGKFPDAEVARRTGHPVLSVKNTRCKIGIPCAERRNRPWTEEEDRLLGQMSDEELARRSGRSKATIRHRRTALRPWPAEALTLLGTAPDKKVAAQLRLPVTAVIMRRRMLKIPRHTPAEPVPPNAGANDT
jgi:hypothetical protein